MRKVPAPKVVTTVEASESPLPPQVQEALGELVGAAREGLLALSVGVGLGVVHELMEAEVDRGRGPEGQARPRPGRQASRPRGRVDDVRRPARAGQPPADAYGRRRARVAGRDVRLLRRPRPAHPGGHGSDARRRLDPQVRGGRRARRREVEDASSATSKSTISELFVERTRTALGELMSRRLDDVRLAVMMLDGLEIADRTHVVALGISTDGVKIPLGLWEGSTENADARPDAAGRPGRPRP